MTGDVYTVINYEYFGVPTPEIAFQWKRNGINIPNATGISYETQQDDYGINLSVDITINNMFGTTVKTLSVYRPEINVTEFPDE